jgi:16S rRNA (adenine1518-N6/adenine1519-N6)-dimethyltransferase
MAATPPDLSVLGIGIQVFAKPSILFDVPPEAFVPRPKVMSSVVLLEGRPVPAVPSGEQPAFFRLVTAGFAQKRKTVLNSLSASLPADREVVRSALQDAGVDPIRRAETLSIDEWLAVGRRLPIE